jgi:hypothetical protein
MASRFDCAGVIPIDASVDTASDAGDASVDAASDASFSCGSLSCAASQICVSSYDGIQLSYRCGEVPAACSNVELGCGCLRDFCGGDQLCNYFNRRVFCTREGM